MRPLLRQLLLLALTTPTTTQQQPQRYGVYVQSDSRAPSEVAPAKRNESWWWASAALTARQAARHGDRYVHYRVPPTGCVAADGLTELTAPWCKVRAMLQAMDDFPDAAVFLYLDSDAAVSPAYANRSLVALGDFVAASVLWLWRFSRGFGRENDETSRPTRSVGGGPDAGLRRRVAARGVKPRRPRPLVRDALEAEEAPPAPLGRVPQRGRDHLAPRRPRPRAGLLRAVVGARGDPCGNQIFNPASM